MSRRRPVLISAAALAAGRVLAEANPRVRQIGFVGPSVKLAPGLHDAFFEGLQDKGYVEGRNIAVRRVWTDRVDASVDAEVIALPASNVELIAVSLTRLALLLHKATTTLPLVLMNGDALVENGLAASLARPGGNVTGVVGLGADFDVKKLQLLAEMAPSARRVAFLTDGNALTSAALARRVAEAAPGLGLELLPIEARSAAEIEPAIRRAADQRAQALLCANSGLLYAQRQRIAALALQLRLPSMLGFSEYAEAGGLATYGAVNADNYRRAADFVDRILRGAKPGELPIERPTRVQLVLNLKTARAIGLNLPPAILMRADRVIE
jgi:putative tryptophan/tyrosine transport system substrate-binding protein